MIVGGKEMFPATACAKMLGYANPQKAIREHCKGVNEMVTPSNGGSQKVKYIPEGDLYRLIIRSKLPSAEKFEKWVFDEVLPAMRRGELAMPHSVDLEKLISITVSEVMKQLQANVESPKDTRTKHRVYGKIDYLPTEMKDEVIHMLFAEKRTYFKISCYLKENGYDVSKSAIGRYASKLYKSIDELELNCEREK